MTAEQTKVVDELIEEIERWISPPLFDSLAASSALLRLLTAVEGMQGGAESAAIA